MLKLKNVSASVDSEAVLHEIDLEILPGEIHAIIGPKKSGKSTLAHLIQGNSHIKIDEGSILYKGKNIAKVAAHRRSKLGIFTTFQYPPEVDGLTNLQMLKAIYEIKSGTDFTSDVEKTYRSLIKAVGLNSRFPDDPVSNAMHAPEDYKKNEIVQLIILQPDLIILDEVDLDLNLEDLLNIASIIKAYLENKDKGVLVISSCKTLLDELEPDYVHVLVNGKIRDVGTKDLLKRISSDGDSQFP